MVFGPRSSLPEQQDEQQERDTIAPAPDSGRRPRPREQLATLREEEFESHDTIPAPPWDED